MSMIDISGNDHHGMATVEKIVEDSLPIRDRQRLHLRHEVVSHLQHGLGARLRTISVGECKRAQVEDNALKK